MTIRLTITAILLALKVRKITHTPLDQLIVELSRTRRLPGSYPVDEALQATNLACRIVGRLGLLNSCLTRALVMGTLIADRPGVTMHIGFRPSDGSTTAGHAWLTCNGKLIPFFDDESREVAQYQQTQTFTLTRPNRQYQ